MKMEQFDGEDGGRFRDSAWDNQLDNMLDDLQASVAKGDRSGHNPNNTSSQSYNYKQHQNGHTEERRETSSSRAGGEGGAPLVIREQSKYSSSSVTTNVQPMMGSKRGIPYQNGHMEQQMIEGIRGQIVGMS